MKFNIKPVDCNFIVDRKKKTVVCIYDHCEKLFISFINDNCPLTLLEQDYYFVNDEKSKLYTKLLMPNKFVGVSICSKDDEWDEKKGKIIAFSRMKDKINRSFFKRANTYFNIVDKWLDNTYNLINEIGVKLEKNQEHRHLLIDTLINEKENKNENN